MAKGVFTFRITSEGVEELRKQLEALGPSGQKAFDQLKQLSPQLKSGFEQAAKSADAARAKIEQMPRGLATLSASFENAESGVKKVNRSLNDAVGAFTLLGGLGGSAGASMSALGSTIGNVSDVFGTLGGLLSKHPLLSIASVAALAATAFVSLRDKTETVTLQTLSFADAIKKVRDQAQGLANQRIEVQGGALGQVDRDLAAAAEKKDRLQRDLSAKVAELAARSQPADDATTLPSGVTGRQRQTVDGGGQRIKNEISALEKQAKDATAALEALNAEREKLRRAEAENVNEFAGRGEALTSHQLDLRRKAQEAEAEAARAAAAAAGEELRRREQIDAQLQRSLEAMRVDIEKRNLAVGKYIDKLEEEARLAGQTNDEREAGRAIFEAQSKLIDEMGNKIRDLTEAERERITVAIKTKEAMEDQAKAAAKVKQEVDRAAARSTDRLVDFAGDALFDRLSGKVTNFWDNFRQLGQRALAQIASEMVFRPIIAPIVSAAVGAAPTLFGAQGASASTGGASGGGLGGLVSSPFSSLLSTGGSLISSAFGGSGGLLQGIGSTVGGLLGFGGGAGAAALGAFSAGAFGATAGATGAAAAAVAGSSLAAGGISGAAAGSTAALAGGAAALSPLAATGIGALIAIPAILAISGLFGKKKNVGPFASYAAVMNADGSLDFKGGGEKNGGSMSQMQEATQSFASAIKQAARILGIFKTPAIDIGVGSNKQYGTFFGTAGSEAGAVYFGQDPGVAAAAYLRRSFQGTLPDYGSTIGASTEAAKIFARTTGDVQSDLEFVAVYQSLDEAASAASEVSMALDELNSKFDDYAEKARTYGLEVERIEAAREKAIESSVATFLQPVGQRLSGISSLVGSLKIGGASPLSAQQQLDAASSQFSELSASALSGDATAQSALGDAGRTYLDLARGFFGTTESYGGIFRDVLGQLGDVVKSVRDTDPTVRAIVETGERGTAAVTKMLGKLIDSVDSLSSEVRRSNDMPVRIGS